MQSINGKIHSVSDTLTSKGKEGNLYSYKYLVIKKRMKYKIREIAFMVLELDLLNKLNKLSIGDRVVVEYYMGSYMYNERFFTTLYARDINKIYTKAQIRKATETMNNGDMFGYNEQVESDINSLSKKKQK